MTIRQLDSGTAFDQASSSDLLDLALEAYSFAYPLLVADATRRVATSVARADGELGSGAPLNEFSHLRRLLGVELGGVSRPSLDTLYSFLWFDVSVEPLVISLPGAADRFYAVSLFDHWSEVFASVGARTTGTAAQAFAIAAPWWGHALPSGVRVYQSPTARGWLLALTEVRGLVDVPEVARFQAGMRASSWSTWRLRRPLRRPADAPGADLADPVSSVMAMTPGEYFGRFCQLTRENPPHAWDGAALDRLRRLGVVPGQPFVPSELPRPVRHALEQARHLLPRRLKAAHERGFRAPNGWRTACALGTSQAPDYLLRAAAAHAGIGARASEDAVDFTCARDAAGASLRSSEEYRLTFPRGQQPPVHAFWSLTLYDARERLAVNPLGRFTLGSSDDLLLEPDGSLTLYLQRESPGGERERNWLPAPESGSFSLSLRLYWPGRDVLDGAWAPPPVRHHPACQRWSAAGNLH